MPYADREKQKQFQRLWCANRRREYIAKMGGVCCKPHCGITEDLQVDHISRETKVSHRIWSWSRKRIEEELKKCQLLCPAHHLEKTIAESPVIDPDHGTAMYKRGCRCEICVQAKNLFERVRRRQGKEVARDVVNSFLGKVQDRLATIGTAC